MKGQSKIMSLKSLKINKKGKIINDELSKKDKKTNADLNQFIKSDLGEKVYDTLMHNTKTLRRFEETKKDLARFGLRHGKMPDEKQDEAIEIYKDNFKWVLKKLIMHDTRKIPDEEKLLLKRKQNIEMNIKTLTILKNTHTDIFNIMRRLNFKHQRTAVWSSFGSTQLEEIMMEMDEIPEDVREVYRKDLQHQGEIIESCCKLIDEKADPPEFIKYLKTKESLNEGFWGMFRIMMEDLRGFDEKTFMFIRTETEER